MRVSDIILRPDVHAYRWWARRALVRRGYTAFLAGRPADAIRPNYEDLWFLYRLIRRHRPQTVLEFGSGCTTVVMAYALRDNESGHLYSVESDPRWCSVTVDMLPPELVSRVSLSVSPVEDFAQSGQRLCRHMIRPDIDIDFL